MKVIYLIAVVLFLTSCQFQNITITGTAPGMDGSTVSILGDNRKIIYGANIQDGKFEIAQQVLNEPGYYTLAINKEQHFGIYLEPGKYTIELSAKRGTYPIIHCSSKIQNDLGQYRRFIDSISYGINHDVKVWLEKLNAPSAQLLPDAEYQTILTNLKRAQDVQLKSTSSILDQFATKYPKNGAIAHAMNNMSMESNASAYYKIFQKLDPAVKNSDDGKKVAQKLNVLISLAPGSIAPGFSGETPDGKKVNVKDLHKKIVIVAFWRSGSGAMAQEQYGLAHNLLSPSERDKVGIISVSFDTDRNTWLNSIQKSGLHQTQICDLKGDDSPNAKNWNIELLPNYYILDGEGKILYDNLSYQALTLSAKEYLEKH